MELEEQPLASTLLIAAFIYFTFQLSWEIISFVGIFIWAYTKIGL